MKSALLIGFLSIAFLACAQHGHHKLEELLHDKDVTNFERQIGMKPIHYHNSELCASVDSAYRNFFDSIKVQVENGVQVDHSSLDQAYEALIMTLKPTVETSKPGAKPPNPLPVPESTDCDNLGFEGGNFVGWVLSRGETDGMNPPAPYSFINEYTVGPNPYHVIQSGGTDAVTGISRVNPNAGGGNYSVMLGNGTGTGRQTARLRYNFLVDANTALFEYSYAVVFQSPLSHQANRLPYFTVRIFDAQGDTVNCGNYSVIANSTTAPSYSAIQPNILYKDWETVITNLSAFMGQTITLEFTAGDCALGAHYGYAYVDASCNIGEVTATQDTICPGVFSTLTAPIGADIYTWSNGDTGQSITVDSAGTYTVTMTPFQAGACDFSMDYTLYEKIGPQANFIVDFDSICPNDAIVFTDQSTAPTPLTITGYQWDFGNGIVSPFGVGALTGVLNTTGTHTNPTHLFLNSGSFPVALTVVADNDCQSTFIDTVFIAPIPAVAAGPDLVLCDSNTMILSGTGADSYIWNQGVTNGVPFLQDAGLDITYTVTGTTNLGCTNMDQVNIQTLVLPIIDAGLDQTICIGDSVLLSGSGAATYTWDNGIFDSVEFLPPVGTMLYTITGTDLFGCENTDQVSVTVNPLPVVDAGPDQTVCDLTFITLNGSGSNTPVWSNGIVNGIPFEQPVGMMTYYLYDTLSTGCFASDSLDIEVLPNPVVTAVGDAICYGESAVLSGQGAVNYSWTEAVMDNVLFYPTQTSSYTVTGIAANGCQDSETVIVVVYSNPIVNFTVVDSLMNTLNPITTFDNLSTGASSYEWDFGDGSAINTEFEPIHEFPYQNWAQYEIMLIGYSDDGCSDAAYQVATVTQEQTIYVPNTFTPDGDDYNQIFLPILQGYDENDYVLYIYNRWGELIFESHNMEIGWDGTYGAQKKIVQDGTYVWKIVVGFYDSTDAKMYTGHVSILK